MTNMNAEAVQFEIERLQECCAQYRDDIRILSCEGKLMREALIAARDKLQKYRMEHSGEYIGGKEYAALMRQISDAVSKERDCDHEKGYCRLNVGPVSEERDQMTEEYIEAETEHMKNREST